MDKVSTHDAQGALESCVSTNRPSHDLIRLASVDGIPLTLGTGEVSSPTWVAVLAVEDWASIEPYATPVCWLRCFHGIDTVTANATGTPLARIGTSRTSFRAGCWTWQGSAV